VWDVAVQAAFHDGRMLPKEWAPLVRMAASTALVDGHCRDQLFGRRAVGVVATRAGDLPTLPFRRQGHVGVPTELHFPHTMALAAQVVLDPVKQLSPRVVLVKLDDLELSLLRRRAMDRMAGHAGDVARLVGAPPPEDLLPSRVALETDLILFRWFQGRFLAEAEIVRRVGLILQVLAPRAVAGLASARLEVPLGELRAQELAVECVLHLLGLVLVAALAGVAPDVGGPGDGRRRGLGLCPQQQGQDRQASDHTQ